MTSHPLSLSFFLVCPPHRIFYLVYSPVKPYIVTIFFKKISPYYQRNFNNYEISSYVRLSTLYLLGIILQKLSFKRKCPGRFYQNFIYKKASSINPFLKYQIQLKMANSQKYHTHGLNPNASNPKYQNPKPKKIKGQ